MEGLARSYVLQRHAVPAAGAVVLIAALETVKPEK